jgi:hypothetical protein
MPEIMRAVFGETRVRCARSPRDVCHSIGANV